VSLWRRDPLLPASSSDSHPFRSVEAKPACFGGLQTHTHTTHTVCVCGCVCVAMWVSCRRVCVCKGVYDCMSVFVCVCEKERSCRRSRWRDRSGRCYIENAVLSFQCFLSRVSRYRGCLVTVAAEVCCSPCGPGACVVASALLELGTLSLKFYCP